MVGGHIPKARRRERVQYAISSTARRFSALSMSFVAPAIPLVIFKSWALDGVLEYGASVPPALVEAPPDFSLPRTEWKSRFFLTTPMYPGAVVVAAAPIASAVASLSFRWQLSLRVVRQRRVHTASRSPVASHQQRNKTGDISTKLSLSSSQNLNSDRQPTGQRSCMTSFHLVASSGLITVHPRRLPSKTTSAMRGRLKKGKRNAASSDEFFDVDEREKKRRVVILVFSDYPL